MHKVKLFDTHCHLDMVKSAEIAIQRANRKGVKSFLVPSVHKRNFSLVKKIAQENKTVFYVLGIHPCFVETSELTDLVALELEIQRCLRDKKFLGIGEIGIDFFRKDLDKQKMEFFFEAQLQLAEKYRVPVVMHIRKAQDRVLKYYRKYTLTGGLAHAFTGSPTQLTNFLKEGILLGFGGTLTYDRSTRIRNLFQLVPDHGYVLETDSPDMSPSWSEKNDQNTPENLLGIAEVAARLRSSTVEKIADLTSRNMNRVFPRLALLRDGNV